MKAALLAGIRKIEIRDVPGPEIENEDQVLLRIGAAGICGSDLHYYLEGGIADQVVEFPFVVGHECAGIIEKAGRRVMRLKPGDRVAVDPAIVCGRCDQCRMGRPNTCRVLLYLGTPGQLPGSLCEYIVVPERNCFLLGADMSLAEGVLVEPLSIAVYSFKVLKPCPRAIAVLGAGPIGLSVCLTARACGVGRIYLTDRIAERVEASRTAGATWSANPLQTDIVAEIQKLEPGGLDAVFECCGDQAALDQAIDLLKPGGKLMILGIPASRRVSFDIHALRRREITVHNVRRQRHSIPEAIALIQRKKVDVCFLATHEFKLEETAPAFELAAGYRHGVLKAIIRPY
ncbi:MAG: alcohol dehydrogenase catalytic domain-containing protein [Acidobacteriota bacterium]